MMDLGLGCDRMCAKHEGGLSEIGLATICHKEFGPQIGKMADFCEFEAVWRIGITGTRSIPLATNLPQGKTDRFRKWRISAGYSGSRICGKNGPEGPFLSV